MKSIEKSLGAVLLLLLVVLFLRRGRIKTIEKKIENELLYFKDKKDMAL